MINLNDEPLYKFISLYIIVFITNYNFQIGILLSIIFLFTVADIGLLSNINENFTGPPLNSSNLYNPINSNWSTAWDITEKILLMISKEVKNKDKDFILVSLSNPIQVNPKKQIVSQYKEKNNIKDIFMIK